MSYKNLGDRKRAEALIPFLIAADELHGLCVATIVNKNLRQLCLGASEYSRLREVANLKGRWKDRELEEAPRTTHIVACLIGGLSQPGQHIYWVSDEDNLFGNVDKSEDVARLLSSFSTHYVLHDLGELGIGTTKLDEADRPEEDLTAVADLAAGGIAETTNRLADLCGGRIPAKLAIEPAQEFLPKAGLLARWFWLVGAVSVGLPCYSNHGATGNTTSQGIKCRSKDLAPVVWCYRDGLGSGSCTNPSITRRIGYDARSAT